ncbi:MAG: 3-hydroxyacyl-CoA dehydrogenase, partial [Paracoccaceae bacterium]|nr:3-hydroxyacyl-CoA dehydrogenase [Paracoccaceae bacterium]
GGGTMGAGIAYALLNAGMTVELIETDEAGAARARENVEKIIRASVQRGLITQDGMQTLRARLGVGCDFGVAAGADLAIEAAFESMAVKQEVFLALQRVMRPDAVLATNTSYLNVDEIAAVLEDPSRLIGLHFFAPAHIMKLLEIVRGKCSSDPALATGFALAKHLRKIPVLAGVCDGFIGNRILFRYREAADALLIDGATPWQIDEAMVEFGYAMGPYEVQDLSGLDIGFANRRRLDATRDPGRRYIKVQDRMVEAGRLGRKAGIGWYRYPEQGKKQRDGFVEDLILREAREEGITRRAFTAQEITRRLLLAMINEAAEILHEGIAQSAADIDLVTVHGYGFPRWRGGLMRYADELGAENIRDQLNELCTEDASLWRPGKLVLFCAEKGMKFADWRKE